MGINFSKLLKKNQNHGHFRTSPMIDFLYLHNFRPTFVGGISNRTYIIRPTKLLLIIISIIYMIKIITVVMVKDKVIKILIILSIITVYLNLMNLKNTKNTNQTK